MTVLERLAVPSTGPIPLRLRCESVAVIVLRTLAVPSTGPIPLRPACSTARVTKLHPLAVPSTGPIPLRRWIGCVTITVCVILQYPLPGLSHCDSGYRRTRLEARKPCSTLYRAYPIATENAVLDPAAYRQSCSTLYRAYPIATDSSRSGHRNAS